MSSAVTELEAGLQAMLGLKPPGVSGSRITSITALCVANVQAESVLIQKIYTHFKKAPATHKLGVLYVVDSVTRKWLDQAKANGQPINSQAQDGTFAAGVHRVTELMPVLMNDITHSAPDDQKEKIKKLVDIWEKGQTFPAALIESFKEKLNAAPPKSTTPDGTPPPNAFAALENKPVTAPVPSSNSIMEALANIARQNASVPPSNPSVPAQDHTYSVAAALGSLQQPPVAISQTQPPLPYAALAQPVTAPAVPYAFPSVPPPTAAGLTAPGPSGIMPPAPAPSNPLGAFATMPQPGVAGLDSSMQQQLLLIKALAEQGVPFDKIPALIQTMTAAGALSAPAPPTGPPAIPPLTAAVAPFGVAPPAPSWNPPPSGLESRDPSGYRDGIRSPRRNRSRSRSPGRHWDSRDSPRNNRDQFDYGQNSPGRGRPGGADRDRDGRGSRDNYRQRSPQNRRGPRSPSPHQDHPRGANEKWIQYDESLPAGHIKVLSRTLFVGGVTVSESELRAIFNHYGTVQTCIVNREKRHAFVKMITRDDAVRAKDALDERHQEYQLRCRWGVGFGPRDCSDYSTGISVIPISKLTEADRKWMLTAEYGGSGGRKIETGLVVEEPDIEIGAGVSSKAISRRMATDKGGHNGPKSTRGGGASGREDDQDSSRWKRNRSSRDDNNPNHMPVAQPNFPFGIPTMANGMPSFPPGFMFPAPNGGPK